LVNVFYFKLKTFVENSTKNFENTFETREKN